MQQHISNVFFVLQDFPNGVLMPFFSEASGHTHLIKTIGNTLFTVTLDPRNHAVLKQHVHIGSVNAGDRYVKTACADVL